MTLSKNEVVRMLHKAEQDHNIVVLFAAETGSIAQGLDHEQSDNDIKFIYARPTRSYLGLGARDDVIENPYKKQHPDLDFTGWDVQKALDLSVKSNPSLVEWLSNKQHVYHELPAFTDPLRKILLPDFNRKTFCYHHYGLAKRLWSGMGLGDTGNGVNTKDLMMLLRSLLIIQHMRLHGSLPPWKFETMLDDSLYKTNPVYQHVITLYNLRRNNAQEVYANVLNPLVTWIEGMLPQAKEFAETRDETSPNILQLEKLCLHMTLDSGRLF